MKKHILFIVENFPAPLDKRVWHEALVAKEIGFDVTVISPENERARGKYVKIEGIEIFRHPNELRIFGKFGFLSEYMNALFWEFYLSIKVFLKKPFHIIHAANPPDTIFLIALFLKPFGVKFIFDIHDLTPELYLVKFLRGKDLIFRLLKLCEKFSCKLADSVITTNLSYNAIVKDRHNLKPKKIFIVRNDPKPDDFHPIIKAAAKEPDRIVLLFIGSINSQDGVDNLLYALHFLINGLDENNFVCNIIGGGESLSAVKHLARILKIEDFIDFKGWITEKERIKDHLFESDICIEPAPDNILNRHSTFIKVMEYMAAGKPVVAFDLKETRFSTNNSAVLVQPGDIKAFAKAIKKLIDEPLLRQQLGHSGKSRIANELNWKNASRNLKKAYEVLYQN
jgi:glycosyltransferase involved in cell wall biosynthesis